MQDGYYEEYIAGDEAVPVEKWGVDHWSTLMYIEAMCVDNGGIIKNEKMRCNARLHRHFAHDHDGSKYPTRLAEDEKLENHDDWSCLEDFVALGLCRAYLKRVFDDPFGNMRARVELTDRGF